MTALLLYGDTERHAAIRHEIPLSILDPLLFADVDGRRSVLTSTLESPRIAEVLPDAVLYDFIALGLRQLVESGLSRPDAEREVVLRAVAEIGVESAIVPGDFPLAIADRLRAEGITLTVDDAAVEQRRRAKNADELQGIRAAQRAAEAGMAAARDVLFAARAGEDGLLWSADRHLHAEDVRAALREACAAAGAPCPPSAMVTSINSDFGHDPGMGPLPAGVPIVIDLWPRHEPTGCWADMTRTFVVGEPRAQTAAAVRDAEARAAEALAMTVEAIRPGVTGRELNAAVCDLFEGAGYPTSRTSEPGTTDGFQFALGHGVGLEVHEAPLLGAGGREPLVAGDVLAVEPGLYRTDFGGVRFEDLILVTETGAENLTQFSYALSP